MLSFPLSELGSRGAGVQGAGGRGQGKTRETRKQRGRGSKTL
ncbi:MAG: hypothetical protein ACRAVC_09990 [Trichormus sp.]